MLTAAASGRRHAHCLRPLCKTCSSPMFWHWFEMFNSAPPPRPSGPLHQHLHPAPPPSPSTQHIHPASAHLCRIAKVHLCTIANAHLCRTAKVNFWPKWVEAALQNLLQPYVLALIWNAKVNFWPKWTFGPDECTSHLPRCTFVTVWTLFAKMWTSKRNEIEQLHHFREANSVLLSELFSNRP